ncbi:hypothetical protein [Azospirillum sp. SYSU D00513]|uniref:hypothetical protein n=1 Tax=Azospirillum sp. SYSU D00513 TaxID=2812561 RepID=UPI001A96D069|nr:hypothetical protein [Azospirillum sp. SYSU D00513]
MNGQLESFIGLSILLTGFDAVRLRGSGMAEPYLKAIGAVLPPDVVGDLLSAYEQLPPGSERERERVLESEILGDPRLGPVARNLIVLWYCGSWTQLPPAWRAAFGESPLDTNRVISGAAYQAGLQWEAAGGHPPGANPQGYGAWASGPQRSRE